MRVRDERDPHFNMVWDAKRSMWKLTLIDQRREVEQLIGYERNEAMAMARGKNMLRKHLEAYYTPTSRRSGGTRKTRRV